MYSPAAKVMIGALYSLKPVVERSQLLRETFNTIDWLMEDREFCCGISEKETLDAIADCLSIYRTGKVVSR